MEVRHTHTHKHNNIGKIEGANTRNQNVRIGKEVKVIEIIKPNTISFNKDELMFYNVGVCVDATFSPFIFMKCTIQTKTTIKSFLLALMLIIYFYHATMKQFVYI